MRKMVALCLMLLSIQALHAAESMDARLCNLQAREIALRAGEEASLSLSKAQRERLSTIAEEVCIDYASRQIISDTGPTQAAPAVAALQADAADADAAQDAEQEEESRGIFGGIKFIDPKDRVRRAGLKRR